MFDSATLDHAAPGPSSTADLALRLSADAYWHLIRTLRLALPPPPTNDPAAVIRRDHAAIAGIAALAPANAVEAELAAQFVAATEQWKDCTRLAQAPETSPQWAMKCHAQATAMMRQANSALRLVLRLQDARRKLETDSVARDRVAWTEHTAMRLMAEALAQSPPPAAEPTAPAPTAEPPAQPEPNPGAGRVEADLIAAAERYAVRYPERAARIRRTGRLPCDVRHFDPPEAALARALIAGQTPALIALDATPLPKASAAGRVSPAAN